MNLPSLKKADVKNKTVLLRADFDTPLIKKGAAFRVADDFRIIQGLPTIKFLLSNSAKILVLAHLGRPKGPDEAKSLLPVAECLSGLLGYKFMDISSGVGRLPHYQLPHVFFFKDDFRLPHLKKMIGEMNAKDVMVLENLKFYPGEGESSDKFARELAGLGDIFVNDAFASSYDGRASLAVVPQYLPHYAGIELEKEISVLSAIARLPKRPYALLVGGIKLSDKLEGVKGMMEKIDRAVVGGGLASLFFQSLGYGVGKSIVDSKSLLAAKDLIRNFRDKITLPSDVVVARSPDEPGSLRVAAPDKISPGEMILDIGPETIKKYSAVLKQAKTIVWSGPMGKFEIDKFSHGTKALGWLVASRGESCATVVAGGGDTLDAIRMISAQADFSFLSTGGSAMLQFLAGKKLPGLEALKK